MHIILAGPIRRKRRSDESRKSGTFVTAQVQILSFIVKVEKINKGSDLYEN